MSSLRCLPEGRGDGLQGAEQPVDRFVPGPEEGDPRRQEVVEHRRVVDQHGRAQMLEEQIEPLVDGADVGQVLPAAKVVAAKDVQGPGPDVVEGRLEGDVLVGQGPAGR
jgi:hypothetical protein